MSKNLRINNKQFVDGTRKLSFVFNGKKLLLDGTIYEGIFINGELVDT